jgi:hypothetical protein
MPRSHRKGRQAIPHVRPGYRGDRPLGAGGAYDQDLARREALDWMNEKYNQVYEAHLPDYAHAMRKRIGG